MGGDSTRVKPIPPTLREKRRYLLIRNASWQDIISAMRAEFGRIYTALTNIKKIEDTENYVIIRVRRDFDWIVRAAIALHDFGKCVWVEHESGTIRRLKRKMGNSSIAEGGPQHLNNQNG